jgi:putative membrane-bound dehydrogenase-like protein
MKSFFLALLTLAFCHGQPVSLFDGKTLNGWDIPEAERKWWKVEDGKIIGGSMEEKVPLNTFLSHSKTFTDFDLRFKVKLIKKEGFANSGIQVRSLRKADAHMSGYQVDAGIGYWGTIWDEHRRNKKIATPVDEAALKAVVKDWDWNDYRILCEGSRIRTWINGVLAIDYNETDPSIPLTGLIGFQAHSGGKFLVEFKDITIEELKAKTTTGAFQAAPEPKMGPIEHAKPRTPQEQQAAFHLPPGFSIELIAAEDPTVPAGKFISVYFDQRGRMWTHTALEYPVDANENTAIADALYASKAKDKILIYNRESVFGKPIPAGGIKPDHVFADGLAIPLGILPWGDGSKCYAQHGRNIVLLTDTNNDNVSDKSEVILEGFGVQDSHLFPHQFTRAPGGWIWFAQGAFNYSNVKRPLDPKEKAVKFDQTRMARFRPDGTDFEITSNGPCNIWGFVMDRNGESFIQEANDFGYGVMPFHEYGNYPGCSNSQWKSYAPEFPGTFAKQRFGGTGLSGLCLTDAEGAYPAPYSNLMLVANPITCRINTVVMQRDQPSPEHYLTDWQFNRIGDFLTCDDPWFRPVAMTLGPDGCVYIVDWYNKIISHNEVPRAHPDRDKLRGRIWRIKHNEQKKFEVPDFTKLNDAALQNLLKSPSLAQTQIAAQALADRKVIPGDLTEVPALMAHTPTIEQLEKTATSPNLHVRRETARALAETATLSPALLQLRKDPDKNVRREALTSIGYWLGKSADKNTLFLAMLNHELTALDAPQAQSTRKGAMLVREAYDREYERYVVRLLLERYPADLVTFLSTETAKNLPVESFLLAALALPPAQGASLVASRLNQLQRIPNQAEVLLLVLAMDQPGITDVLREALKNPTSSQAIINALLANKNRIAPERIQALIVDSVDRLLQGNGDDVKRGVDLSAAFGLKNTADRLQTIALNSPDNTIRISALDALATQKNANPIPLTALLRHADQDVRISTLKSLASSHQADAGAATIVGLVEIPAQFRAQIIEILSSHKSGASALVSASLTEKLKANDLSSIALNRLQTVLGDDAELKKLLTQLGDKFRPVLQLNGKDDAMLPTTISLPGAFTVETWVKLHPGIDNSDGLGGAPELLDINFAGEQLRVYGGSQHGDIIVAKKKIVADLWTHVAVTRNAAGACKLYFNGELDNAESKVIPHTITNFMVGWSTAKAGTQGQFAEYRIWNRERSSDEIRASFDRSMTAGDPTLLFNGTNDQGWGKTSPAASLIRTLDVPPVMSLEQAKAFDAKYQRFLALAKTPGNAEDGKALSALCIACHQFGNTGGSMGPNLSSVGAMGPEAIVRNILTPNAAIEPGYRIYRVTLKDGSLLDAFFVSEDKNAVVIRQMGAADRRIERKDIASTQFLRQSLMPEGLLDSFTDQQRKDLFAYLMSLK